MEFLLTGPVQVGKTTVLTKALAARPLSLGGFTTRWAGDELRLRLLHNGTERTVARRTEQGAAAIPHAFDRTAAELRPGTVTLLDELGFLEARSPAFTAAVLALMDRSPLVVAVVRQRADCPFWAHFAGRSALLLSVTEASRDGLPGHLIRLLDKVVAS